MKIIESDSNRLVLRSFPSIQILVGLVFALSGLLITFFFGRSYDLHCVRAGSKQVDCRVTQKLLGFQVIDQRKVTAIQKVEVDESTDSDGDTTYKVVFITPGRRVPLTSFSSSGYNAKADLAHQINNFINSDRQASLDIQVKMEWWILIFLFTFTGVGVVAILLSRTVEIHMLRSEGLMRILKGGIFGTRQEEHILREIESVELESSRSSEGGSTYRIAIHTVRGEKLLLSRMFSSGRGGKQQAVDAMNQFLAPYHQDPYGNSPSL
jgi:hypothetical protein